MAMHKVYRSVYGCWIKCLYIVNGRYLHFTVYQPYNQIKTSNQIAIAVTQTPTLSAQCLLEGRVEEGSEVTSGNTNDELNLFHALIKKNSIVYQRRLEG